MADQIFGVNCGFFNAVNYDRTYTAEDMNKPYSRFVSDGIFPTSQGTPSTDLQVVSAGSGMKITVKAGQGMFASKWFENPSSIIITVPNNNALYPRFDSVIVQVDMRTSGRKGNIVYRTGTPASNPQPPSINTLPNVTEYRVSNVYVAPGANTINNDALTDLRGTSACPWVEILSGTWVSGKIDEMNAVVEDVAKKQIDGNFYAHPKFMADIAGYSAQSFAIFGKSGGNDLFLIGFSNNSDSTKSLLMVWNSGTSEILSSAEFSYGHVNSLAVDDDGVVYLPQDNGRQVYRFTVTDYSNSELSITPLDPVSIPTGWTVNGVFGYDGTIYVSGKHNNLQYYWPLGGEASAVEIPTPDEMPRVVQTWGSDGHYLYRLRSSPNAMAVYDFASGDFIRWVNIGDYIGSTYPIGEIENLCFTDGGKMLLLSQLFYNFEHREDRRYWMISELKPSSDIVPDQQHIYPNLERTIYVSNVQGGALIFRTNSGDTYPTEGDLTGSENYPYHSLDAALYAATATPYNNVTIIMMNTGTDYTIDDIALNMPAANISIQCLGNVKFKMLKLYAGVLSITGNATFESMYSAENTGLYIDNGIFNATSRVSNHAPYILGGRLGIIGSTYTGGSSEIIFEFKSGSCGVVGFTSGSPVATNYQQTNLTLLNVITAGAKERWTTIYNGDPITVGAAITLSNISPYVGENVVYRVRWCLSNDTGYSVSTVHVHDITHINLGEMITVNGNPTYRVAVVRFRPRVYNDGSYINGDIRVISVTDYTVSGGVIVSSVTSSGTAPSGFDIDSIEIKGY